MLQDLNQRSRPTAAARRHNTLLSVIYEFLQRNGFDASACALQEQAPQITATAKDGGESTSDLCAISSSTFLFT
jgi:hypothetical protein